MTTGITPHSPTGTTTGSIPTVNTPAGSGADSTAGLVLHAAVHGQFGSYQPDDVTWLLTDLSPVALEQDTATREHAIQTGTHYSEMLPVEYQPADDYVALFHQTLTDTMDRLAVAVGVVGEQIWSDHATLVNGMPQPPVLVSLARAGTPIGVLLRRYFRHVHHVKAPHYTISIIRGRGIDTVALAHILDHHPASAVVFVDGWTGKGAIQKQLTEAVTAWVADHPEHAALDDRLAVLADPGSCTPVYGTRDDFLIPSAALNSTVSGLVSRTVFRDDLIQPGMFHGAKYYAEWAASDVSRHYVDTVAARFPAMHETITAIYRTKTVTEDTTPHWSGWATVTDLATEFGITDINLVKPGVGETTRVLLRRVPWKILVRDITSADVAHVLMLARDRGVEVIERPGLAYSCVGLIQQVAGATDY